MSNRCPRCGHRPAWIIKAKPSPKPTPKLPSLPGPFSDRPIEELELDVRAYNCLKLKAGYQTVGQLLAASEPELAALPNFGPKSLENVVETLARYGLKLRSGPVRDATDD
jgi:DNA-directed RNA polymerase alpha subunit